MSVNLAPRPLSDISPHGKQETWTRLSARQRVKQRLLRFALWLCLLLACAGTSWFAFQYFLLPQPRTYAPPWVNAHWIQATDTSSPIAYYHYAANFNTIPDNAYMLLTANQLFRLYVNGIYIGSNTQDFVHGEAPRSYMFDVDSVLLSGTNSFAIRVADVDKQQPQLRAELGVTWAGRTHYFGSDGSWQATGQTMLAHPRLGATPLGWTGPTFDTTSWQAAQPVIPPPNTSALLTVNPAVYTHSMANHWLSANGGQEGYFVRQIDVPEHVDEVLLRLIATGTTDVFINDHQYTQWNGQAPVKEPNVSTFLDDNGDPIVYRNGLLTGIYAITPYLHPGRNTLAIHVQAPGTSTAKVGLDTLKSAISLDVLATSGTQTSNLTAQDKEWYASNQWSANWTQGGGEAARWAAPIPIGQPGASLSYYLPDKSTPNNVQMLPPMSIAEIIVYSCVAVLATWLLLALVLLRRYYPSRQAALHATSLIFLPALAIEAVLVTLAREPLLPQPFPYTGWWGSLLILVVAASALGLWRHARYTQHLQQQISAQDRMSDDSVQLLAETEALTAPKEQLPVETEDVPLAWKYRLLAWLRHNWGILPIMLIIIPMVCYNIGYEPYWQDELSSYNAALNVMQRGFPAFPSGFVYPKGELFSYLLAGLMFIFGTQGPIVPRLVSLIEYLVSIPLLFLFAQQLFNRRVAWLSAAMLAFSTYALIWSRQTRMYEQAQFGVILVIYTLYRAVQQPDKKRLVYLAITCLIVAYLSHEENFILLPGALICTLLATREGPYGFPAILRKWHWWIPALIACSLIIIQLLAVYWTHPPTFATDQSRRPQIQPGFDNLPYYFGILFQSKGIKEAAAPWNLTQPWLLINSLLTVLGCVLAFLRKDRRARFCALFLIIASVTLIFMFTMQADRYYYPLLPIYYMLGAYAFWSVLQLLWRFARPSLMLPSRQMRAPQVSFPIRIVLMGMVVLLSGSVLLFPALPMSNNYNLLISRVLGLSHRHHFADYDNVSRYMHTHLRQGDTVVAVAPAVSVLYYVGQIDYYFSIDRALFLMENNKKIVETTSGGHPLLNQQDFQNVLASHNRVWLITDNGGYQSGVTKNGRFTFPPPDFRMVYEGYGSAVYFRSGNP